MNNELNKSDNQSKEEREQQEYLKLRSHYLKLSLSFLFASVGVIVIIIAYLLMNKVSGEKILLTTQVFFLFCSLFSLCISAVLHWNYRKLSEDSMSFLSEK